MSLRKVFNVEIERRPQDAAVLADPNSSIQAKNKVFFAEMDRANLVDKEIEVAAQQNGIAVKFCAYASDQDAPTCRDVPQTLVEAPETFKSVIEKLPHVRKVTVETKPTTTNIPFA